MNRIHRFNAALTLIPTTSAHAEDDLDRLVRRACMGDETAADLAAYELRGMLILEVLPQLGSDDAQDAEDIVDDVLLAMLEGQIQPRRRRGDTLRTVLRLAGVFARRHVRKRRERWEPEDGE
jgi:DNA-directed RNA polymerase specialized sigma24 family protein